MYACWLRWGLISLAVAILATQFAVSLHSPRGDFLLHYEFGRRLRTGEFLYKDGLHPPYPPAWAMPYAPLSRLPVNVAKAAFLLVGLLGLLALVWLLNDLTRDVLPLGKGQQFRVVAGTLFVASRLVIRDFDDGAQNTALLGLTWIGLWLFARSRPGWGGVSLGLAIALKCTAGIFIPYFLLKRQWRMVASTVLWTVLFSLAPGLWQGPTGVVRHVDAWGRRMVDGLTNPDPSWGPVGPEHLQNRSLRSSLARYLMRFSPGHPGRPYVDDLPYCDPRRTPHPGYLEFLDLPPPSAGRIIKGVLFVGMLLAAWLLRKPLEPHDTHAFLWESALVSVLMLLYSPVTWGQHCVAILPAVYLLIRGLGAEKLQAPWIPGFVVGFTLLLLGTNRSVIGTSLSQLLESYHLITFGLVALLAAGFVIRGQLPRPG